MNHFLAKIANNRHSYGFSFAIVGLHPAPHRPGGHEQPWRPFQSYRAGDPPYHIDQITLSNHKARAGLVGLIWQGASREGGDGAGFQRLTHDTASVGDACPHWAYQDPYPLNEQLFLVPATRTRSRPSITTSRHR